MLNWIYKANRETYRWTEVVEARGEILVGMLRRVVSDLEGREVDYLGLDVGVDALGGLRVLEILARFNATEAVPYPVARIWSRESPDCLPIIQACEDFLVWATWASGDVFEGELRELFGVDEPEEAA